MKLSKITLSLLMAGTMSLAMAADATVTAGTTGASVSVDTQIAEIQAAPAQERVQLMNQFKMRLADMNEADRAEAIAQMQAAMQTKQDATATARDTATQAKMQTRTRTQTRAQNMQMQASEDAAAVQNMNQVRTGNQFMNMPGNAPATVAPVTPATAAPTTPSTATPSTTTQNVNFSMPRVR